MIPRDGEAATEPRPSPSAWRRLWPALRAKLPARRNFSGRAIRQSLWATPWSWAAAACLVVATVVPALMSVGRRNDNTRRGETNSGGSPMQASCESDCSAGTVLGFQIHHLERPGFFAAYALDPGGNRLWLSPRGDETLEPIKASQPASLSEIELTLPVEMRPGRYALIALVVLKQLSQKELLALGTRAETPGLVARAVLSFDVPAPLTGSSP